MIKARMFHGIPRQYIALQNINLDLQLGGLYYVIGPSVRQDKPYEAPCCMEFPTADFLEVMGQPMRKRNRKIRKLRRDIGPVFRSSVNFRQDCHRKCNDGNAFSQYPLNKAKNWQRTL